MNWWQVAVQALGSYASSRRDSKEREKDREFNIEDIKEAGRQRRLDTEHQLGLARYFQKKDRAEQTRSLDEFRKFSTVQNFAPGYQQDFVPDPVPERPGVG